MLARPSRRLRPRGSVAVTREALRRPAAASALRRRPSGIPSRQGRDEGGRAGADFRVRAARRSRVGEPLRREPLGAGWVRTGGAGACARQERGAGRARGVGSPLPRLSPGLRAPFVAARPNPVWKPRVKLAARSVRRLSATQC